MQIVLASASPRRRALLEAAGFDLVVDAADVDESPLPGETPEDLVKRLARQKALAVASRHGADAIVVAADTTVALGDTIFAKPVDDADAAHILRQLSGRVHLVWTGFSVVRGLHRHTEAVATEVGFRRLDEADIAAYLRTGEHRDKAGAYGIQGAAAVLVATVHGSLTNVIGLPVDEVKTALEALR